MPLRRSSARYEGERFIYIASYNQSTDKLRADISRLIFADWWIRMRAKIKMVFLQSVLNVERT
jgi:hypothetical protein